MKRHTFDQQNGTASRETAGGGKTELKSPACGKDALAFLYYVRHELSQGRMPPQQTIFLGAPYDIRHRVYGHAKDSARGNASRSGSRDGLGEGPVIGDQF